MNNYTTPNIEQVLASNGVRSFAKQMLREGMQYDCVDAVNDAQLVADLLKERMKEILYGRAEQP